MRAVQQLVAPGNLVAKRLLPYGQVPSTADEHVQATFEARKQRLWGEKPASRRRKLDCQRQAVDPPADLCHLMSILFCKPPVLSYGARALREQRHRR